MNKRTKQRLEVVPLTVRFFLNHSKVRMVPYINLLSRTSTYEWSQRLKFICDNGMNVRLKMSTEFVPEYVDLVGIFK